MNFDNMIQDFLDRNELTLLSTHFKTHLKEFDKNALEKAFKAWENMGKPLGDIEIKIPNFQGITRLWGEKMGDEIDLDKENFFYKSRGEDRPPQRLICRENALRSTDVITLAVYEEDGVKGLMTIYAGPSMPAFEDDPNKEWDRNFLAYTSEALENL